MAEFARVLRPGGHLVTSDIHYLSLYLGGVPVLAGPNGRLGRLPAHRHLPSDYLTAALACGLEPRSCVEPAWPATGLAGGPLAGQWCQGRVRRRLHRDAGRHHLAFPANRATSRATSRAPDCSRIRRLTA
jgi:hypothetical protein